METNGWFFAEAPQAFAAVHVVTGKTAWEADTIEQHREKKGGPAKGDWLACSDEFSPVIIEIARKSGCESFLNFQQLTMANPMRWENRRLDYESKLNTTSLTLFADYSRAPLVDGQPVNYAAKKVFDSPFIQSDFGTGIITIQRGEKHMTLDFNKTSPRKENQ